MSRTHLEPSGSGAREQALGHKTQALQGVQWTGLGRPQPIFREAHLQGVSSFQAVYSILGFEIAPSPEHADSFIHVDPSDIEVNRQGSAPVFLFFNICLFIWLRRLLMAACGIFIASCGIFRFRAQIL